MNMKSIKDYIIKEKLILKKNINIEKEYVDLCLPSGTLWAKCNVGANEEHEMGDLISWGELGSKRKYTWDTYEYGNEKKLTKYNDADNLTKLELTDDAAYYKNKNMCLPSKEQFTELIECTEQKWVYNYNNTGVNGMLFIGKNNESMFLPAAGKKRDNDDPRSNKIGSYFTNSLYFSQYATFVTFDSMSNKGSIYCNGKRYVGMSMRPVLN